MQKSVKKLEFEFGNSTETLITSLQYMLGHITGSIPPKADSEDILFRCKVIITELLTNAIKHAGLDSTLFDIETDGHQLIIQKTDRGAPFYLINANSHSSTDNAENKKLISADPLNSLYAVWESENRIRFASVESMDDDTLPVEQIMEHFGILIITRSSDEFTYTYHANTNSNIFKVRIDF
jgi:anti-sigma regulatory factor (Ser/Thr protein kinase)